MATIRAAFVLYERMIGPLRHMTKAMSIVLNNFEAMQGVSGWAVDVAAIQKAREELTKAETVWTASRRASAGHERASRGFDNGPRSSSGHKSNEMYFGTSR